MTTAMNNYGALESTQAHASDQVNTLFQMDQRKNEFLATLAHELRNPLTQLPQQDF